MDVSFIIVNYNTKKLTLSCLDSIYKHTQDINFEIILVDNASIDGSVKAIEQQFPDVKLIKSNENLGFGRANNLGVRYAQGEFLFLLNSDTLFIENSLKKMYDFFKANEKKMKMGVLGSLMIDEYGKVNGFGSSIPTPREFQNRKLRKIPFLRYFFNSDDVQYNIKDIVFQVGYVLGADMFLRKTLFEEVGGFDKRYFMYYEESDLQNTITKKGYRQFIYTGTKIVHLEGKSFSKKISNTKRLIVHCSEIDFMRKNYPKYFLQYKLLDMLFLFLSVFNIRYSVKENFQYIISIVKKYKN
ncbi:glycosyltransferase family 2 protein [Capnocytophaga canimorsus]|uniref:Glycosyl transferase family 2 n=1 Tax=Capnocytophaga canimorsus TaxID=28188 RepID=A0A1X7BZF0_9FLAO|nr:glycosyltransferase family 2 protein [Capnocytophaga canimorsus]ATA94025.1 glycosyl transferase family 2 [Capnocytophaga canimorsus]GIM59047.1 glycosyl transferase [Capnocytophaga canimorsus]SMD29013.1 conserved hypothetical protein [Capnocytophaga canimorsus]